MMKILTRINRILGKIEYGILSLSILLMAALLGANAISGNLFHSSIFFANEINQLLVLAVTFIGLSNAARCGKHISMTAIYDALPQKWKRAVNVITNLFVFGFLVFLTILIVQYILRVRMYGRTSTVLAIPMYLVYSIVPIGCILGALQYLITSLLSFLDGAHIYTGSEKQEAGSSHLENITKEGGELPL